VFVESVVISTASTPRCDARGVLPLASIVVEGRVRSAYLSTREGARIFKKRLDSTGATRLKLVVKLATEDARITIYLNINRVALLTSVASAV
jgi:hypothetical protein